MEVNELDGKEKEGEEEVVDHSEEGEKEKTGSE